ncbi:MAG: hypothetical protein CSA66_04080 [Proteobacteria bacterium]|nr:MAG: hypothetical protein CSA66_04080 [Pseudomonadota bacterium]
MQEAADVDLTGRSWYEMTTTLLDEGEQVIVLGREPTGREGQRFARGSTQLPLHPPSPPGWPIAPLDTDPKGP